MSDRCYIHLVCAAEHAHVFTQDHLDFRALEGPAESGTAEFEDPEFCEFDYMPTDIPFIARFGPGYEYAAGEIVCDGHETSTMTSSTIRCYEIELDESGQIRPESAQQLQLHVRVRARAVEAMAALEEEEEHQTASV